MIKNFFFAEWIKKNLYFICNTNIFCVKIYFWNEIYIFYIFIYIFLCKKKFFSVKKIFIIKLFSIKKTFFCATNVYFVKSSIFSKKYFFFNLVLQQMNNHTFQANVIPHDQLITVFKSVIKSCFCRTPKQHSC